MIIDDYVFLVIDLCLTRDNLIFRLTVLKCPKEFFIAIVYMHISLKIWFLSRRIKIHDSWKVLW